MNLRPSPTFLSVLSSALILLPEPARAQAEAADDFEVPSTPPAPPEPAPQGAVPAPASPAPVTESPAASTPQAPPEAPAVPPKPAQAPAPAPASKPRATAEAPSHSPAPALDTHLERTAYGRPVPRRLTVGGYVQAQYEHNDLSEDQLQQGGTPLNFDRFVLRRARLRVDRGWEFVAGTLEIDLNTVQGPSIGIRRAEGSILYRGDNPDSVPPLVMLSAGVTDLPFGFELAESSRVRAFMERSLTSSALFPTEMDVGAKLSGAVGFLRYGLAVSNGEPVSDHSLPRDPNSAKDVTGRAGVELALSPDLSVAGGASFAIGEGFHPGNEATKGTVIWIDENEDRVATSNEFYGIPATAETASENFDRWAFGLDLGTSFATPIGRTHLYGELYVAQNYDRGFLPSDPVSSGVDVRQAGGYAAVVQRFARYGLLGFRCSVYDPNSDLIEERAGDFHPKTQTITTYSLLLGGELPDRARLSFQYDFVRDFLARDRLGVPTDADNDQWTLRLQVDL